MANQPGIDWITWGAADRLNRYINRHALIFEWGAGPSTLWLAERSRRLFTVEPDPDRYNWMAMQIGARGLENVTLLSVDSLAEYTNSILHTKLRFDLIKLPDVPASEEAKLATQKIVGQGVIVLDNSTSMQHHREVEYLTDWAKFSEDFGDQRSEDWMTSLYHRY